MGSSLFYASFFLKYLMFILNIEVNLPNHLGDAVSLELSQIFQKEECYSLVLL